VSLSVYAPGRHEELGRGGRYVCGEAEPATGVTLYPDAVLRAMPARAARARVYLPAGTDPVVAAGLRAQGFATVAGFEPGAARDEARRLGCSHVLEGGHAVGIGE
jgi:ATP phosphoribosyltransferase regulatory subunit